MSAVQKSNMPHRLRAPAIGNRVEQDAGCELGQLKGKVRVLI
jgi:hypothetical protein